MTAVNARPYLCQNLQQAVPRQGARPLTGYVGMESILAALGESMGYAACDLPGNSCRSGSERGAV